MAEQSTDLSLYATIETESGISAADAKLPRILSAASEAVRSYLNRPSIHYAAGIVEKLPGPQRVRLVLSRTPVLSIASITYDGSTVDSDEYEIEDADAGLIYRRNGWAWTGLYRDDIVQTDVLAGTGERLIHVTYTGGWITPKQAADGVGSRSLPYDLEDAVIQTVVSMYRQSGNDRSIASESLGAASVSYVKGAGGIIPDAVLPILDKYRRLL